MQHESNCACRGWVRLYGVGQEGERHHRDCKHWHRKLDAAVYVTRTELIVVGSPDDDDVNHNCDALGCTSVSHVLYRVPLASGVALPLAPKPSDEQIDALVKQSPLEGYALLACMKDDLTAGEAVHTIRAFARAHIHPAFEPEVVGADVLRQAVEALESLIALHWPLEEATTDDGCYTNDPCELQARAALASLRSCIGGGE